jgi:hypothetical protein
MVKSKRRSTRYATELTEPGVVLFPDKTEGRLERILVKERSEIRIRASWWKAGGGGMLPNALDLTEEQLMALAKDALLKDVFSREFREKVFHPDFLNEAGC